LDRNGGKTGQRRAPEDRQAALGAQSVLRVLLGKGWQKAEAG